MFDIGAELEDKDGDRGLVVCNDNGLTVVYHDSHFGFYGVVEYNGWETHEIDDFYEVVTTKVPATKLAKRMYPNNPIIDDYIYIDKQ